MQSPSRSGFSNNIIILLFAAVLAACASGANIQSDYDPGADFGSYTTYDFMEGAGPDSDNYQSFFSKYMIAAITIEMEKRGYTKAEDPDLWVNFNAILQEKTQVRTSSAPPPPMMGGYYGYRGASYGSWGGYGYATETHVSEYTEGTFNIDIIDSNRHQLVWEAVGVGRVSQKDLENLEEGVMQGVPKFFALYPFRAGDPHPVVSGSE
jgi:hypothetical protein